MRDKRKGGKSPKGWAGGSMRAASILGNKGAINIERAWNIKGSSRNQSPQAERLQSAPFQVAFLSPIHPDPFHAAARVTRALNRSFMQYTPQTPLPVAHLPFSPFPTPPLCGHVSFCHLLAGKWGGVIEGTLPLYSSTVLTAMPQYARSPAKFFGERSFLRKRVSQIDPTSRKAPPPLS